MPSKTTRIVAGGIAAGLVGVAAEKAQATIIYTSADQTVDQSNPEVDIDLEQNGTDPMSIDYSSTYGLTLNKQTNAPITDPYYMTSTITSSVVSALSYGEIIGAGDTFGGSDFNATQGAELNNAPTDSNGQFVLSNPPAVQYIGIDFDPTFDTPSAQQDYGWIGFEVTNDSSTGTLSGIVTDYAYDDSGASIMAGEVPEPTGLALLALGATGLLMYRRRIPTRA